MPTLRELIPGFDPSMGALIPGSVPASQRTLRSPETVGLEDQIAAADMGQLRRGFASGRITGEANAMAADMSSLRAAGRTREADELSRSIAATQQRAGVFAPAEQDVTKLNWEPGRILDYGLGAVGQGAASMMEPIAAAAGLGAAGRVLSAIPTGPTRLLGAGLGLAAPAAAGYLNYRQNKGEFVSDAYNDLETLRTKTPQQIENAAMFHGAAAGALDTMLPVAAAGRIVGKSGMKAFERLGFLPKTALDMAGEAVTETGQEAIKKKTLGFLNPNRDTSGDASDYWNSAAGGALGAGPFSAASNLAAKGYARLGVKDDGQVGDSLAKGASARPGAAVAPSDASVGAALGRRAKERATSPQDEAGAEAWRSTLMGTADDGLDGAEGFEASVRNQHAALVKELGSRAENGDAAAQHHLDTLNGENLDDPTTVFDSRKRDAARDHLIGDGEDHAGLLRAYQSRKLNQMVPHGDLGGGKVTGRGDDVHPTSDPVSRATAAARSDFRQRVKLVGETLAIDVPAKMRAVAMSMGEDLMEFGAKSRAGGIGKQEMNVAQRMANQFVKMYGGKGAEGALEKAAFHAGVEGTPLYKELRSRVILAANPSQRIETEQVGRQAAADELAKALPPLRVKALAKQDGANLADAKTRLDFLDTVEKIFNGEGQFNESALTREFGEKTVATMRDIVVGQPLERKAEAEVEAPNEVGGESGKTAAVAESDRVGEKEASEDARAAQEAAKSLDRAPGARQYFFKGRDTPATDAPSDGASSRNPFVRTKRTKMPTLLTAHEVDSTSKINSLKALVAHTYDLLGLERKATETKFRRGAPSMAPANAPADGMGPTRPEFSAKRVVRDNTIDGKDARFKTEVVTAKSVMDFAEMADSKRLDTLASYLTQTNVSEHKEGEVDTDNAVGPASMRRAPTGAVWAIKALDDKIEALTGSTPKIKLSAGKLTKNAAYTTLTKLKKERLDLVNGLVDTADIQVTKLTGKTEEDGWAERSRTPFKATEDTTALDLANAYFNDRHLVVADEFMGKDHLRIVLGEFREMTAKGAKLVAIAAKAGGEKNSPERRAAEAGMNLIRFHTEFTRAYKDPETGASTKQDVAVPASDIVTWVFKNKIEFDKVDGDDAAARAKNFRNALMSGIAAMLQDGFMEGTPYMRDASGRVESFQTGFPPSLHLGPLTQAELNERTKNAVAAAREKARAEKAEWDRMTPLEKAKARRKDAGRRSSAVASEQDRQTDEEVDNTDADELLAEGRESPRTQTDLSDNDGYQRALEGFGSGAEVIQSGERYWDAPAAEARLAASVPNPAADERGFVGPQPKAQPKESRAGRYPLAPETNDKRSDAIRTPLDAESDADGNVKPQKQGAMPSDFTDTAQRTATANAALDKIVVLTPSNAMAKGTTLAKGLWGQFVFDRQAAFKRVQALVRTMATAPQYAVPLALILTPDRVAGLVYTAKPEMQERVRAVLAAMQSKTAGALLKAGQSPAALTTLARGLTGNEKLTPSQAKAALTTLAQPAPLTAKPEPAAVPAPAPATEARKLNQMVGASVRLKDGGRITISTAPAPESFGGLTRMMFGDAVAQIATNEKGEEVGRLVYMPGGGPIDSSVRKQDRRRGIASALYDAFEAAGGKLPNESDGFIISDEARAFRADRKLNQQATAQASTMSTDAQVEEARAYVEKVLGPKIVAAFAKTLAINGKQHFGEFIEAKNLIELSMAAGPMMLSVAHHESMHALWSQIVKSSPDAAAAMRGMANSPRIVARLNDALAAYPDALAAIQGDSAIAQEERIAYSHQLWAAGELVVDKKPATWFAKVRRALRIVFGMVRDSESALDIMTAFHAGKLAEPSAAGKVIAGIMAKQTWNEDIKRKFDKYIQHIYTSVAVSNEVMLNSESKTMRELATEFYTNPGRERDGTAMKGYLNGRTQIVRQYTNFLHAGVKNLSEAQMVEVVKVLQNRGTQTADVVNPTIRKAVGDMRALTKRYYDYATQSVAEGGPGLKLEFLGENHYPRIWDLAQLVAGKDKFTAMLNQAKYDKVLASALAIANANQKVVLTKADIIAKMHEHLMDKNGVDDKGMETNQSDIILSPFFASQKERSFKWLDDADVEPFLEKDLVGAMSRYLHQGIRAAEFTRRFGNGGERLRELTKQAGDSNLDGTPVTTDGPVADELRAAAKEKGVAAGKDTDVWVARRMEDLKNAVAAHEGSLGHDISPTWRKMSGTLMAYQNLRLLPLSLFAAFADPMIISARGDRGMAPAWDAMAQGLKDVWARWKDAASDMPEARVQSVWDKMAEASGAVDSHMFLEQIGKAHTSEFTTDWARKSNRWLFMANGLTAWDRSMRVTATKYAALFIADHKDLPNKQHSARWLAELGLKPSDISLDEDGVLIFDRHVLAASRVADTMTDAEKTKVLAQATVETERIHTALVRWVEGAVLTPNAAQRPIWASDPRWGVLFHLKQFTYSFQDTVLRRAANEARMGNMGPVGSLLAAVPVMMVSDVLKGFVQGGGSLPAYMKAWGFGDHLMRGASGAGLGGVSQFGIDALRDPVSLLGPTVEQAVKLVMNPGDIGANLKDAVPGLRMLGGLPDLTRVVE